jgi:hypothetical protein
MCCDVGGKQVCCNNELSLTVGSADLFSVRIGAVMNGEEVIHRSKYYPKLGQHVFLKPGNTVLSQRLLCLTTDGASRLASVRPLRLLVIALLPFRRWQSQTP